MHEKIREAHHTVYEAEAKAAFRLRLYADRADKEGFPQIARLFRAISRSEEIHGERSLRALEPVRDTQANLEASFESETKVAGVAYQKLIHLANELEDKGAATVFSQSRDVEATHARLYKDMLEHLTAERETTYHVCTVCGYVADGTRPETCPVCGVPGTKFIQV
ncbi:MAG: rubrerythrin family protein [Deltaproteobacteria bacterium]|nr:rubrerythrin family protein [Deltaproteobacteria bacterium]